MLFDTWCLHHIDPPVRWVPSRFTHISTQWRSTDFVYWDTPLFTFMIYWPVKAGRVYMQSRRRAWIWIWICMCEWFELRYRRHSHTKQIMSSIEQDHKEISLHWRYSKYPNKTNTVVFITTPQSLVTNSFFPAPLAELAHLSVLFLLWMSCTASSTDHVKNKSHWQIMWCN